MRVTSFKMVKVGGVLESKTGEITQVKKRGKEETVPYVMVQSLKTFMNSRD